jgi:hypothetical protein
MESIIMTISPTRLAPPRLRTAVVVILAALTICSAAAGPAMADNGRHRGGRHSHWRHGHSRDRYRPHVYYAPAPNYYYAPRRRYYYAPPPVVYYPRPPSGAELFFGLR